MVYIIAGLLLISVLTNIFLLLKPAKTTSVTAREITEDIKWLSPHIDDIAREDRLVHFSSLKNDLNEYIDSKNDVKISVYFEYLSTGTNFSINVDYYTYPASLTKVPLAIMILDKVQKDELDYTDRYPVTSLFKDEYAGDLYKVADGTTFSLKQLVEANIVKSDNTAKNILYSLIDEEDINSLIDALGVDKLFNEEGNTTAKEYARVFRSLYYASMLTREDSQYLLDLLTKTNRDKYMTSKIPLNIPVAHKYASMKPERSFSDVGIVYLENRPYLIAVTIDGRDSKTFNEEKAKEIISTINEKCYNYVSSK